MELAEEWIEERLEGDFIAEHPEQLYPIIYGEKGKRAVVGVYEEDKVVSVKDSWEEALILNATKGNCMYLDLMQTEGKRIVIKDCKGNIIETMDKKQYGILKLEIPSGGMVNLS